MLHSLDVILVIIEQFCCHNCDSLRKRAKQSLEEEEILSPTNTIGKKKKRQAPRHTSLSLDPLPEDENVS